VIKLALPKGHLWDDVKSLLNQAGYGLNVEDERTYLISCNDSDLEMRMYRAQNVAPLVEEGKYDLGITGLDWIVEHRADVEELMDLRIGRVDIVVAVPQRFMLQKEAGKEDVFDKLKKKVLKEGRERIIVASEYENLAKNLCEEKLNNIPYKYIRSYGVTETFIEVADLIVECTETGRTLRENGWDIIYRLFQSTARILANRQSSKDENKRDKIEGFLTLIDGAKEGRSLKLLKMNVPEDLLKDVTKILPAMKSPTISRLYENGEQGYAIEVAVKEEQVVQLIPLLKKKGATDILEMDIKKAVK